MKRTLITLMFASAALVAEAAEPLVGTANLSGSSYDFSTSDGVSVKLNWTSESGYGLSKYKPNGGWKEWTNTLALEELNIATGQNLTAEEMNAKYFIGCTGSGADTYLTLDFSGVDADIDLSNSLTIYVLATSAMGAGNPVVTGLDNYSVKIATPDGNGFNSSKPGGYGSYSLFKVTGNLQEDMAVTFTTNKYKDVFAMVSYVVPVLDSVPEPTTATLSLLALAGLAVRRRRVA